MAFNKKEEEVIRWGLENKKPPEEIKQAVIRLRGGSPVSSEPITTETQPTTIDNIKSIGTGFAKGAAETVKGMQDLGQRVLAGISPTKSLEDIKSETPINFFENIDLESKNNFELAGKTGEFLTEVLFPVSKLGKLGIFSKGEKATMSGLDNLAQKASSLPDELVVNGQKIKDRLIQIASKLDEKTKTALSRTPKDIFQNVVEQGKKAIADDRVQTPLEVVGESVSNGLKLLKDKADEVGKLKSAIIKLPEAFEGRGIKEFETQLQSFLNSRSLIENDKGVVKKIVNAFDSLGDSPTKGQVDKFIDFVQDGLYAGEKNLTLPVSNKTTGFLRGLVGKLNSELKTQLPSDYTKLNDEYAKLINLINEVNTRLGKKGASAGSFVKRLFSPSDARTKVLFDELGKITGQDYFRDARLAKFVMESLGDTRVESLLEQIPKSTTEIFDKMIDFAVKKTGIKDPIKAAEKFIEQNVKN